MHLFSQQKPLSSANNVYSLDSDWNIQTQKVHLLACHQPLDYSLRCGLSVCSSPLDFIIAGSSAPIGTEEDRGESHHR